MSRNKSALHVWKSSNPEYMHLWTTKNSNYEWGEFRKVVHPRASIGMLPIAETLEDTTRVRNRLKRTFPDPSVKFRAGTTFIETPCNYNIWIDFCFWCVFRRCVLPEGLAKKTSRNDEKSQVFGQYRLYNGF